MSVPSASSDTAPSIAVPPGYTLHKENSAQIILPDSNGAFLNPVQEFNRDLSVACITVWSELANEERKRKWDDKKKRRQESAEKMAKKQKDAANTKVSSEKAPVAVVAQEGIPNADLEMDVDDSALVEMPSSTSEKQNKDEYKPHTFTLLEALSATGLRSIRYAKEIPLVRYVIANDLSPEAVETMRKNVELNGLGPQRSGSLARINGGSTAPVSLDVAGANPTEPQNSARPNLGKVRVNEGDACALMYSHRAERSRVDVVDLDPYGTAAPFMDGAVQCVNDGGLLCVTCTDLSVLANTNYPEKCYANYGGVPAKAEYCHEVALRLVLHSISTTAAKYGRFIEPILSLSIDFYVRLFIKVRAAPIEVKKAASKTSLYYICTGCQSFHAQPLGKVVEKVHEATGNTNHLYKTQAGPPISSDCPECGNPFHVAGPMWSGPLHSKEFAVKLLEHIEKDPKKYGTSPRMKGMVTVASEELETPFYFTPTKIASFFHCQSPPLEEIASALLHAGHPISRSHACAGSLKTTATREEVLDVFRNWIKTHPVKMENIKAGSPASRLLAKEPKTDANFKKHAMVSALSGGAKLVRYQQNPTPNWGPAAKAGPSKRKRTRDETSAPSVVTE
ncbi:hypothetical protein BOTBODRAFT_34632 [Botryobasidium botryosum FD-172 SS1]|uniref:tRNA (guanine(26)-N(2))-dimethyltransferase n=1 Tax=Botryobasidium botryosum (strain FD-172 SS1) TaxID=930990 RepID=A0A067M9C9_BOTB1|nr:hypothetical protein BOTBODRAFT_34632 [Botryobasidium botryosum FD-172 SS1]